MPKCLLNIALIREYFHLLIKRNVEEVQSEISASSNKKRNEKALVRRITNEMQIAQYDKCANEQTIGAAVTSSERANERCNVFIIDESCEMQI